MRGFTKLTHHPVIYWIEIERVKYNNADTFVDGSIGLCVCGRTVR